MAVTDKVGDMLTRIRNAYMRRKLSLHIPASSHTEAILSVLAQEGYISSFVREKRDRGLDEVRVQLRYHEEAPAIRELKRVSTPGRRIYVSKKKMPNIYSGLGVAILSTPVGVVSDATAKQKNVGGEFLCYVF